MNMEEVYILKAIEAALLAGAQIREVYDDPDADFQVERKADNSPLTIADRRANEVITRMLQQTPYPVLSEEGKQLPYAERAGWKELWIVDPLDGTKEFIKRNGEFTVNIAGGGEAGHVCGGSLALALHAGDGSLYRTDEAGTCAGGVALQWQFAENLPGSRGKGRCLSSLCSHDGVGYGGRTCHCACRRWRNLAGGQA